MKLKKYIVSIAFLLVCAQGFCCGPYWYYPHEYYMYRVWDGTYKGQHSVDQRRENLRDWYSLCPGFGRKGIEEVVYDWGLDRLRLMANKFNLNDDNQFAQWINDNQDTELVDYLVLMRECEQACANRIDPWYYQFKDDPDIKMLRSVIVQAKAYKGQRLLGRYTLQAVRAMFSLKEYDAICDLWQKKQERIPEGVIKEMIAGYVAGAELRRGNLDKSIDYYIGINNLGTVQYCLLKMGLDHSDKALLAIAAEKCPDNPEIPELLHRVLYGAEDKHYAGEYNEWEYLDYKKRMQTVHGSPKRNEECLKICQTALKTSRNPAVWYYSAAFLADLNAQPRKASEYLKSAEKTNRDAFLGESIKVMRMYLDSKLSAYDAAYEQKLFAQLKWLDEKITSEITGDVQETTESGYRLHTGFSYYYWNDMLRKIVIGEVCPRMEDAGRGTFALRLMNMADNRLLGLVNSKRVERNRIVDGSFESVSETISMEEYRNDGKLVNEFDYSNYFFNCMDGIDLSTLRRYSASAGNPSTEFERFLDERSYINKDYIHEVIGTRYLRNQQYQSAVKWLEKVSEDYQSKTNVKWYMRRDPFEYRASREGIRDNYKLSFAREMAALEKQLHSANPDERGLAMVKYGTGLRSSFTNCWALTQYHRVNMDWWEDAPGTKAAISKAESMIKQGLRTIRNPEKAAEAYFSQALYTTAAKKFASTRFMEEKFTQCPKLEDYK